jgi:Prefoldin subunit
LSLLTIAAQQNRLVLETLEPLPEDRKCFRLINGVLVERTVKEVVPALKTNSDGLKTVLDGFVAQYKAKQDEMDKWKVCRSLFISSSSSSKRGWCADWSCSCRKRITYRWFSSSERLGWIGGVIGPVKKRVIDFRGLGSATTKN